MPGGIAIIMAMPLVGYLLGHYDPRLLLLFGLTVVGLSLFHMTSFDTQIDFRTSQWLASFRRSDLRFYLCRSIPLHMRSCRRDKNNAASGLINLARNIGGSVGISLVTTMLDRRTQYHQNQLVEHVNPGSGKLHAMINGMTHTLMSHGSSAYEASHQAYGMVSNLVTQQATMLAYIDNFKMLGVAVFTMIPFVFLMKKIKPGGPIAAH